MSELEGIIRTAILANGPMRFDRFMEMALYHPGLGYYAKITGPARIGKSGDFFTSVSVGPLFGRLLARQFYQLWHLLGKPQAFAVIEQGAHDGQLARDIVDWCRTETPDFFDALRYGIVLDAGLAPSIPAELAPRIITFPNLEALAVEQGVFISNELLDAFPVRRIVRLEGEWREQHIEVEGDNFVWSHRPIDDAELAEAIVELDLPAIENYTTEINLRARHWIAEVARSIHRGYVVTIDYGWPASIHYAPFRTAGTLTARHAHQIVDDILCTPGEMDLTAHVDFTSLAQAGETAGLSTLGFLDQQRFLTGIAHDELSGAEGPLVKIQENLRAWNTLTHPGLLGARFHALVQAKNAPGGLDCLRFARPGGL